MLDDLKMIHHRDSQDTLGAAEKQWQQLGYDFSFQAEPHDIRNVICAGMSTSAYGADLARVWPGLTQPLEVLRGYDVPAYVGPQTLFVACSFSGSTEETLSALAQAEAAGAVIAVVTAGGALADIAREKSYPLLQLPSAGQSRFAGWYVLRALLSLFEQYNLCVKTGVSDELAAQAEWFAGQLASWRPDVAIGKNLAKQLALELMGKSVVIYGGPKLAPVAYRWKTAINENAKQVAWAGQYPEFNHNEFSGWSKQPVQKPYAVVELRSALEHPRVQRRFELSERLLSGMRPAPIVVEPQGESLLRQILYTTGLGDFVSLYLGLLGGLDPAPMELVSKLKKELG